MGVFTQVVSNIKFVCKSAYASCVNGALGESGVNLQRYTGYIEHRARHREVNCQADCEEMIARNTGSACRRFVNIIRI